MSDRSEPGSDAADRIAALTSGRLLARNAVWTLLCQVAPMAVAIATIPPLIRGLGTDRFGVLTLAWMVLGYCSLFDLGLGRALTKLIAERLGEGRERDVPDLIWTGLALMTALGLAGAAAVGLLAPWIVGEVLRVPEGLRGETLTAFRLLAVALPFVIGTAGLRGVMEAHQRFAAINAAKSAFGVITLLGPLLVLPICPQLGPVVGVLASARVASWAVHAAICLRTVTGLGGGSVRRELIRPLIGFGGWMTVANVVNPLMVQMDRFLIGALVSTSAIAFYTTPHELVTKFWLVSGSVVGVIFPAFATSYARDRPRASLIFGRGLKAVFLILLPMTLGAVALAPEILGLWLGGDFADRGTWVMRWLAVGVLLNGLAMVSSALLQGAGRPDLVAALHLIELPLYLLAAWIVIPAWGITGAAIVWAGRTALDLALFSVAARRVLPGISGAQRRLVIALAAVAPVLAAAALLPGTAVRAMFLLSSSCGYVILTWCVALDAEERLFLIGMMARFRPATARGAGAPARGAVELSAQ